MIDGASDFRGSSLKSKKASRFQALDAQISGKLGFSGVLEGKLHFLVVFAVLYGLVFINYIDIASSGLNYGYHLWLVLMYFLPFVGFSMLNLKNWQLTIGLGLIASLMNDVFYWLAKYAIGIPTDLSHYYHLWLIPSNTYLFNLNLGFTVITVTSWMMALSIYLRIAVVAGLLWNWKIQYRNSLRETLINHP
jgi:hypothetical protein